jgi:acetyl esterase
MTYVKTFKSKIMKKNYETIDPTMASFLADLEKQDGPPIYTLSPEKARNVLDALQARIVNTVPAEIKDITIPGSVTKEISLRIIRPKNSSGALPIILFVHGGGWILGNKNTHDRLVREISNKANAAVVFVNYSLSPEAHYPVAIEQTYETLQYIAQHGESLSLDSSRIAICGDSVGGLMATAVARLAKERSGAKLLYQALLYPVTDANFLTGSYEQFAEGYWLTKKAMMWFWDAYVPNVSERNNASVAPLRASLDQLRGLPPTLIITNEHDVLRDEGEAYAHKLMQASINVSAVRIIGSIHDCAILAPIKDTAPVKLMIEIVSMKLKQALWK